MPPVRYSDRLFASPDLDWASLTPLLGTANRAIARYDGLLRAMPKSRLLLAPLTAQEAVMSSRIEGTQSSLSDMLEYEARGMPEPDSAKTADVQEVHNYRRAMQQAEELLKTLPLSQRLLKQVHATLLDGARGRNKSPGEYRRISNWIGPPGSTEATATYIPISADRLPDGMTAWEKYMHSEQPDALVQAAVLHVEFEALHPFLDGNGRLGRMVVPLFLCHKGVLTYPDFYFSGHIEARRAEYYERLLAVSRDGDWNGWCRFFLEVVHSQAEENIHKAQAILSLYETTKQKMLAELRSHHAVDALDFMFQHPIFRAVDFIAAIPAPRTTSDRLLGRIRKAGYLEELEPAAGARSAMLAFGRLLAVAEGRDMSMASTHP